MPMTLKICNELNYLLIHQVCLDVRVGSVEKYSIHLKHKPNTPVMSEERF